MNLAFKFNVLFPAQFSQKQGMKICSKKYYHEKGAGLEDMVGKARN